MSFAFKRQHMFKQTIVDNQRLKLHSCAACHRFMKYQTALSTIQYNSSCCYTILLSMLLCLRQMPGKNKGNSLHIFRLEATTYDCHGNPIVNPAQLLVLCTLYT